MLDIPDVSRALVMGWSGQNPYVLSYGDNPWLTKEQKNKLRRKEQEEMWAKKSARRVATRSHGQLDEKEVAERKENVLQHIDEVILSNEEAEKEGLLAQDKENV